MTETESRIHHIFTTTNEGRLARIRAATERQGLSRSLQMDEKARSHRIEPTVKNTWMYPVHISQDKARRDLLTAAHSKSGLRGQLIAAGISPEVIALKTGFILQTYWDSVRWTPGYGALEKSHAPIGSWLSQGEYEKQSNTRVIELTALSANLIPVAWVAEGKLRSIEAIKPESVLVATEYKTRTIDAEHGMIYAHLAGASNAREVAGVFSFFHPDYIGGFVDRSVQPSVQLYLQPEHAQEQPEVGQELLPRDWSVFTPSVQEQCIYGAFPEVMTALEQKALRAYHGEVLL